MSFGDIESGGVRRNVGSSSSSSPFGAPQSGNSDEVFTRLQKQITNDIAQIASSINTLKKSSQIVGTAKDNEQLRDTIRDTIHAAQSLARGLNNDLRRLLEMCHEGSDSQQSKRRRVYDKLTKDFEGYLREFREVGRAAAEKERQVLSKHKGGGTMGTSRDFNTGGSETTSLLQQQQQQQQQFTLMQIDSDINFNQHMAQSMDDEIKEIESAVLELNEIFRDLGSLVHDQTLQIDSIERHVEEAVFSTDEGVAELVEARSQQSNSRMMIICIGILVCLAIIGTIVGLVVGLGGSNKSGKTRGFLLD